MSTPDNPPAFPLMEQGPHCNEGMTLRDWFAGQVLNVALEKAFTWPTKEASPCPSAARLAYEMADAMLAQREPQP